MRSAGFNLLAPDHPYMSMEKSKNVNHLPFEEKEHETRSATTIKCRGNILEALSLKSEIKQRCLLPLLYSALYWRS